MKKSIMGICCVLVVLLWVGCVLPADTDSGTSGGGNNTDATTCKVVYVSLGGSVTPEESVIEGKFATEPTHPIRAGYTFGGWYTRLSYAADTKWNFTGQQVTQNTALFAKWTQTDPETFAEADRPEVVIYDTNDLVIAIDDIAGDGFYYGIRLPWNYDKAYNADRKYPLFISLHTGGGPISTPTPPTGYPCLVLSPKIPDSTGVIWTNTALNWLMPIIQKVINDYRIDTDKLFIAGFSQGGAGSYQIANALYNYNGMIFAAISRAAGGWKTTSIPSLYTLPEIAYGQSSVNLRIGLNDYAGTVDAIQTAYELIKNSPVNAGATEVVFTRTISGYTANVRLIVKNGIERARLTEFPEAGHTDLYDSSRNNWFFNQSL